MPEIDDFSVAEDNWQQLSEVRDLQTQVKNTLLWFQADDRPDTDVLGAIHNVIESLELLYQRLVDLQIKLVTRL